MQNLHGVMQVVYFACNDYSQVQKPAKAGL